MRQDGNVLQIEKNGHVFQLPSICIAKKLINMLFSSLKKSLDLFFLRALKALSCLSKGTFSNIFVKFDENRSNDPVTMPL